jgi:hypothetical protein
MNFKIAIPSGNRNKSKNFKTIEYLNKLGIIDNIFLFLNTEIDEIDYRKNYNLDNINIVIAKSNNIVDARNFIEKEYFENGERILCLDDDIRFIKFKDGDAIKKIETKEEFIEQFNKGFDLLKENDSKLFGVYPIDNDLWFSKARTTIGNNYILAVCSGIIVDKTLPKQRVELKIKEEYERAFIYGKNIRLGFLLVGTVYYRKDGIGLRSFEEQKRICQKIIQLYPDKYSKTPLKINSKKTNCDLRLQL